MSQANNVENYEATRKPMIRQKKLKKDKLVPPLWRKRLSCSLTSVHSGGSTFQACEWERRKKKWEELEPPGHRSICVARLSSWVFGVHGSLTCVLTGCCRGGWAFFSLEESGAQDSRCVSSRWAFASRHTLNFHENCTMAPNTSRSL